MRYNENPIIQKIKNKAKSQEIETLTNLCIEQLLKNPVAYISYSICGEILRSKKYFIDFNPNDPENEELIIDIKDEFLTEFFNNEIIKQAIDGKDPLKYLYCFVLGIELYKILHYIDNTNIYIINALHENLTEQIKNKEKEAQELKPDAQNKGVV